MFEVRFELNKNIQPYSYQNRQIGSIVKSFIKKLKTIKSNIYKTSFSIMD